MLVVGAGPGCDALRRELERLNGSGPEVIGQVTAEGPHVSHGWPYLGGWDALPELLSSHHVSRLAVCLEAGQWSRLAGLARTCEANGIDMAIPLPVPASARRSTLQRGAKRALDITGAITGLILAAPVLILTALAIAIVDGPPVFFLQQRAGRGGRPFTILKYRTMRADADGMRDRLRDSNEISGAAFKMEADPRVTRLGSFLRRTSIDELPQLWNVLKGEMSLVGPRPHPYDDVAGYDLWHLRRLSVKPGVTGLWQVELRGEPDFDRWVAKDLEYIDRWSIWLDIKTIARTIPAVLRGTGR
jgi:lipopolysaccharide/colanic/teichoic acid biosynthesis glycosyltransferase